MKLIVSLTSPYARKIRIVLAEKGLPFDQEVDIPWLAETHVPDFNPLGKVPALVADDGEVWYDSPVIAEYLETLGGPALLPADRLAALPVRQAEALADGITDAAVAAFLLWVFMQVRGLIQDRLLRQITTVLVVGLAGLAAFFVIQGFAASEITSQFTTDNIVKAAQDQQQRCQKNGELFSFCHSFLSVFENHLTEFVRDAAVNAVMHHR